MYWTDPGLKTVEVASLEGDPNALRLVLFDERVWSPRGIALNPTSGRLFWSDWDRRRPRIETSNLDGSGRSVLVDSLLGMPNALTVDLRADELCWADGGRAGAEGRQKVLPKLGEEQ